MKKFWKILAISLGSLVGLVLLTVCVALWLVFTPSRLTPIVERQLPKFLNCPARVERVELTFFSSFPRLGLRIDGVNIVNPVEGAPSDTLLRLERFGATVDVKAFWERNEIILSDITLLNGTVNLYADSLGRVNYDVIKIAPDAAADTLAASSPEDGFTLARMDVDDVTIENFNVSYLDDASHLRAEVRGFSADVRAFMEGDKADATVTGLNIAGLVVAYGGEEYIADAAVSLAASVSADLAESSTDISSAVLTIDGLQLEFGGSVAIAGNTTDTAGPDTGTAEINGLFADLHYRFSEWPLDKLMSLVPPSMAHYLDGIAASGKLSSEGTVKGTYAQSSMPVIDAKITLDEGVMNYPAMLPYPLTDLSADIDLHTDFTDEASHVGIVSVSARTPRSEIHARGTVDRLFSDPHAVLTADLSADLADAAPFIPDTLKLTAAGKVSGRVRANATLSQMTGVQPERMRIEGSLLVSRLDATLDTVTVKTPSAKIDFSIPNRTPSTPGNRFAAATVVSDIFTVNLTSGGTEAATAALDGMRLSLETSDVLDAASAPGVSCDFAFTGIAARMDTLSVRLTRPSGRISMETAPRNAVQNIKMIYAGDSISARMGATTAVLDKLNIDAAVAYDASKSDVWQQFSPRGIISADGTEVTIPSLDYPVRLPTLAMDFTPQRFEITRARAVLDESDFSLDGTIDNIEAYFKGEDVLRAELDFSSPVTNVSQLLALTSGLGGEEDPDVEKVVQDAAPDEFVGPYMVPEGIDVTLHASIADVLWEGEPLLTNIRGEVQVRDGALFITPEVSFDSPVTRGTVQLMYRTPDPDNLFAGINIGLERIDIHELIRLIPDLDRLMPQLRTFSGRAEFRAAAEGYMDSTYNFKMSTLRGAGSLSATDLALTDEETFRKIAFLLKYKEEGAIRIDSLRAEFTVFRDQIDVYPFLLKVDRYGAVISGRHNLDNQFDYNISLVESPLPFRVAVDVVGRGDDLQFNVLSKSAYPDFYRPRYNGVVENRQMELRNLIRDSLLKGRKEDEE